MSVSSNYHIEINASDAGIYDKIVVMELIKNAAQTHQLDVNGQGEFKSTRIRYYYFLKFKPKRILKFKIKLFQLFY